MTQIKDKVVNRIRHRKRGWVFTSSDLLDIGERAAITQELSRLARQGMIRRLERGIYYYPKHSKLLGALSPTADNIALALARGDKIFPSGAMAANLLHLSTQVPMKPVYWTNSTTLTRRVAGQTIWLKRTRILWIDNASDCANLLIQALLWLRKNNINDIVINRCVRMLTDCDMADLRCVKEKLPKWMGAVIRRIEQKKYENYHLQRPAS